MKGELVFRKMTNIEDSFIEEADFGTDEGLLVPTFSQRLGRFFSSGLGAAVICAVLGLGIFGAILWSGQHDPITPPNVITIESETEAEATEPETEAVAETETEDGTDIETETETETEILTEPETEFELVTDENGEAVFAPVGNVALTVTPDLSPTINFDGDLSDWQGFPYRKLTVSPNNTVSHEDEGISSVMPMDFRMTTYVAADQHWLYFGFDVVDESFVYASSDTSLDGDAITLSFDFGYMLENFIGEDPEFFPDDQMPISYTFSCAKDGGSLIFLQEHTDGANDQKRDGYISMASSGTVQGAARKTATGWSAEFAIKWDQLYEDNEWKCYADDYAVWTTDFHPLEIGCFITYTARGNQDDRKTAWIATTSKGPLTNTYEDCGINFYIPHSDSSQNRIICKGVQYLCSCF